MKKAKVNKKEEMGRYYTVESLEKRNDLQFISNDEDVEGDKYHLGKKAEGYDSFFVKVEDGDYKEVYGMEGSIPELNKPVWKIE